MSFLARLLMSGRKKNKILVLAIIAFELWKTGSSNLPKGSRGISYPHLLEPSPFTSKDHPAKIFQASPFLEFLAVCGSFFHPTLLVVLVLELFRHV